MTESPSIVGKLWLFTAGALALYLAIGLFEFFVPSFQSHFPLVLIILAGIWAAAALLFLLAEAQRKDRLVILIALAVTVTLSVSTHRFGIAAFLLGYFGAILFIAAVLVFAALRHPSKEGDRELRALVLPVTMILMGTAGVLLSAGHRDMFRRSPK